MTILKSLEHKKTFNNKVEGFSKERRWHTLPPLAVPSALIGLTSLFGMGRGEPYCYNHLKLFGELPLWVNILKKWHQKIN